ncbi:MAG: hypothetical protein H6551_01825 [Chitinophagales bacterium]|nr:hypothetical protein [Chitinophagaceae bacterium]MCB9063862.1 hypothetical protein [Chitinophagales bacterium]
MRKLLYIISLSIVFVLPAKAQTFFTGTEYGISLGGSQYFGDLNDRYGFQTVHPAGGVFTRIHLNPFIAVRIGASYTQVSYDDKLSNNDFNKARNLNFKSDILEAAIFTEFNFFRFYTGEEKSRFTPYLVGGIGLFYYNPYTTYLGRKYYLRTLGTEGQYVGYGDRDYSTFSLCFPVGAGIKYWIAPGVNFGFEISDRLTVTDYMDDVSSTYVGIDKFPSSAGVVNTAGALQDRSLEVGTVALGREGKQRGNSASKDQYMMFTFSLSFQLKTYRCPTYMKQFQIY